MSLTSTQVGRTLVLTIDRPPVNTLALAAVNGAVARFGLTEAATGIPFPAGPADIIRSELPPALLRRWTLSSAMVDSATLIEAGVIDARHAAHELVAEAVQSAASLAAQPVFITVKRQVRSPLAARVATLAASGDEPFLAAFA